MKHIKRTVEGYCILVAIVFFMYLIVNASMMINPDYVMPIIILIWTVFVSYVFGAIYESYKEIKNIKPY